MNVATKINAQMKILAKKMLNASISVLVSSVSVLTDITRKR